MRGCDQSWLVVGEEWLKERMRDEDDTITTTIDNTVTQWICNEPVYADLECCSVCNGCNGRVQGL